MSSASSTKELAELVQQFLSHQAESNGQLSSGSKESLAVAAECIEQAFELTKKPASDELLRIYENHKRAGEQRNPAGPAPAPTGFVLAEFATQLLNLTSGGPQPTSTTAAPPSAQSSTNHAQTQSAPPTKVPKVRKQATPEEKAEADILKNQGNELMKEDKFKEAHECYTRAIEIDDNNAIYYSNRAAACSKLGDHHAALRDCEEAIEIDPSYSKAYGRKALAHASLDEHQKAKETYEKAVELDPNNESYRNNLRIAEEKLAEAAQANAAGRQQNPLAGIMGMMNNPELVQMAARVIQDPRLGALFTGLRNMNQPAGGAPPSGQATDSANTESAPEPNLQQQQQQQHNQNQNQNAQPQAGQPNPQTNPMVENLLHMATELGGRATQESANQLLSMLGGNNPDFMNNMRQMMSRALNQQPVPNPNRPDEDSNPPPGYS